MKTVRKIVLIVCLVFFLCAAALVGTVFYYYTHPSSVKAFVETSLSRAVGASVAIRGLYYSLSPTQLSVEGMTIEQGTEGRGFYLEVPQLDAECFLDGSFGQKRLFVNRLEIKGISGRISQNSAVPGMAQGRQIPSFFSSILKRAFAFLVFRDIQFEGATISDGAVLAQMKDQTLRLRDIQGRLNADHRVEITCSARFEWPSQELLFLAPLVQINTDKAISMVTTQIGCAITLDDVAFESPVVDFENLQAGARLVYRPDRGEVTFEDMKLTLHEATIKDGGRNDPVRLDLHVSADGDFSLKDHRLRAGPLHLTLSNSLQLKGELDAAAGGLKKIDFKVATCRVTPQDLVTFLPAGLRKKVGPLRLGGAIELTGRLGGVEAEKRWAWEADLEARLKQNQVSFTTGQASMSGAVTGSIAARGKVPDVLISTDLNAQGVLFRGKGIEAEPFEAAVSLSGRHPDLDLKKLSARMPRVTARFQDKTVEVNDIRLEIGKGRVNASTGSGSLSEIRFDSSLLKNITGSLEVADGSLKIVQVKGKETGLAGLAAGLGLLPTGWKLACRDSVQVQLRFGEEGVAVTSGLAFQDLAFQNPEGTFMGEKVRLKATLNGKTDPSNHAITGDIAVNADGGEVLYDRFYADLKRYSFSSLCTGAYNIQDKAITFSNLRLGLNPILACQVNGRILEKSPAWQLDLTADIPKIALGPLFSFFVVEPFQTEKPLLRTIQVEGTISANVNLTGTRAAWTARGSVDWQDGRVLSQEKGFLLKEIDLSLPLWLRNHNREGPTEVLKGRLSLGSVGVPFIPEQALAFPLEAGPNRLSVSSSTVIKIPGGDVRLGPIQINGQIGSMPSVSTDMVMDRLDLGPLLARVWPRPIKGTLFGRLNPVRVKTGSLTSSGKMTATVFDGEVIFSHLGVAGLFSATPVFKLDARWNDLNLSELTADTSFGKVEGRLTGYAKGLEIAHGQVQKFDLLLETVRKEGTPQRISVKAVDNIAQIGGGQSPFVGVAGMFASVFKEFPYEKIGVHATLENDVFRINGTIQEGDTEYLVKRGLLSGVNVVNQNPDNQVSFKDMIKRIKRIETSKGGPVIR